jgi:spermidine synthase
MPRRNNKEQKLLIFAAALIVALGGLIYELLLGTASSYLFGDSVKSFSVAIGTMLFGMGLGSLLSSRFLKDASTNFVWNELLISLVGGNAVLLLFLAYNLTPLYWIVFITLSVVIGVFIGMEIPLMVSLVKKNSDSSTEHIMTRVLALDYIGALIASILFPFILLPYMGILRTSYLVAILNVTVAGIVLFKMSDKNKNKLQVFAWLASLIILVTIFSFVNKIENKILTYRYEDPVVYMKLTQYQKIVMTKYKNDTKLFLNDQLQFSSIDESRYHELLVHGALTSVKDPKRILILGGGDGLAAREALKYKSVNNIEVVDIDPAITNLAKENRILKEINADSLSDSRVTVKNEDAFTYVRNTTQNYDAVIVDLVDPSNERVAKLYSKEFYAAISSILSKEGVLITQATSTFFTPNAFKTIYKTVSSSDTGRLTQPLSVNIPSFGEWGFVINAPKNTKLFSSNKLPDGVKVASLDFLERSSVMPSDFNSDLTGIKVSGLINPNIYMTYNKDMQQWSY